MITVFTLCSTNYLAHAKTLGDSLKEHNPDYHFVIGMVDCLPSEVQPSFWHPYELIRVEDLGISELAEMVHRYSIVELNTAVKPFYFEHLYRRDPSTEAVIYLDPDILVCAPFEHLAELLHTQKIIVTPHSCTYDNSATVIYYEQGMLGAGIYNLGFLATSRGETTIAFLRWWKYRLRAHCYLETETGLFVDQLWITLAPLYFPIYVEKHPGYNMCYWNHFERRLSRNNGRYLVNDEHELVFYHFSSYSPDKPERITTRRSKSPCLAERPDLKPLYEDYRNRLLAHGYLTVKSMPYHVTPQTPYAERHVSDSNEERFSETAARAATLLPKSLAAGCAIHS